MRAVLADGAAPERIAFFHMLRLRLFWVALLACFLTGAGWAQAVQPIQLGDSKVHPYRIIAKFADPRRAGSVATMATLKSRGFTLSRRYALVPGSVVLDFRPAVSVKSAGDPDPQALAAELEARINLLRASGEFAFVGPDYWVKPLLVVQPDDARYQDLTLWGIRNVGQDGGVVGADVISDPNGGSSNAWNITVGTTNPIVAVIDTGVRYTHKDLENQMWRNPGEIPNNGVDDDQNGYVDDVYGINALAGNGNPYDDVGHGTHVAGTIGAEANNGSPMVGVAWKVRLMALKFLGANGGFDSDAVECINYAVANGAKVLNNSWGGGAFDQVLLDTIVAASTNGVLFVAAAGNDGTDNDVIPFFPAAYAAPNIISVAALNRKNQLADFSNFGAKTVHIGAPGVEIFSCWDGSDTDYNTIDGTSMASPHVAGIAALILGANPDAGYLEVRERILSTAVPVPALATNTTTGGRANAYNALLANPDGKLELVFTPPTNSTVLAATNAVISVRVSDLFPITNAVVNGEILGSSNTSAGNGANIFVSFKNDGVPPDARTNDNVYTATVDLTPYLASQFTNTFRMQVIATAKVNYPKPNTPAVATNLLIYAVVGPPPNDNFANADKIPEGGAYGTDAIYVTNTFATMQTGEPAPAGITTADRSLWWNWSPAHSGPALVDTAGSSFDTVLAVYLGERVDRLTPVKSSAGRFGQPAILDFEAIKGVTYRITVAGYNTNEFGLVRLRVQSGGQPDTLPPVVTINQPLDGQRFAETKVDVSGTAYDPEPDASGVKQVLVSVNGGLPASVRGTLNWNTSITLPQTGANVIAVYGADNGGNVSAKTRVTVYYRPDVVPNDVFGLTIHPTNAFYLVSDSGTQIVTNAAATLEHQEPLLAGNRGGHSVWWTWLAASNGVLTVTTAGSSFDTLLGVYTGDYVDQLTSLASNDDASANLRTSRLTLGVQTGHEYRISVDGYGGATGTTKMNWSFAPTNILSLTVTGTVGGTVNPPAGTYVVGQDSKQTLTATPETGYVFTGWGGDINALSNTVTVVVISNMTVQAMFAPRVYSADFETGNLTQLVFQSAGAQPWTVTTENPYAGVYSARSGQITNSQSSSLILVTNFWAGPASFYYRVSSEAGWDVLGFYVDGQRLGEWSGEVPWSLFLFDLSEGRRTLEWRYSKDSRNTEGSDLALVDNLLLPIRFPADQQPVLSMDTLYSGLPELRLTGQTNQIYVIQVSTNLAGWFPFSTNVAFQGEVRIPLQPKDQYLFYRAVAE